MLRLVVLLAAAVAVSANVIHENKCPELKPVANFNLTAYQGTWYEISKYPNAAEKSGKCASAEYKLEGEVMKVKNTHVVDGVQTYIEGTAKMATDANKAGKLVVSLKFGAVREVSAYLFDNGRHVWCKYAIGGSLKRGGIIDVSRDSPLSILATDYANYAIAYKCTYDEKNKNHQDLVWILSRSKKLEGEAKTAVDNYLKANSKELDATKFLQTDFSEEACKFNSSSVVTEAMKHH